jgi:hypothetical protein
MLLHGIVMDKWRSVSSAPLSSGLSFGNLLATGGRTLRVMRPTRGRSAPSAGTRPLAARPDRPLRDAVCVKAFFGNAFLAS